MTRREVAFPISFEPAGDGAAACVHDANGAIICEAKYADFENDATEPERIMRKMVALANCRSVSDERALELAHQICTGKLSAMQGAVEIMHYATDAIEQERQHRSA